jgi:hypothetical protein
MTSCGRRGPQGGIVTGAIIVIVGVLLLLSQLGILHFQAVWRFWPLIFVFVGLSKLFEATAPSQRVWGGMLVVIGVLLLAHYFGHFRYGIDQIWPLFVIGGGLSLLFQNYWTRKSGPFDELDAGGSLKSVNVFGGSDRKVRDQKFRGGTAFACFGGYQLDFTQSQIEGDTAVLEASAIFGGGEIRVPQSWNVVVEGSGIFGGYEDSTLHLPPAAGQPLKTLVVRGTAIFGGVEVKN